MNKIIYEYQQTEYIESNKFEISLATNVDRIRPVMFAYLHETDMEAKDLLELARENMELSSFGYCVGQVTIALNTTNDVKYVANWLHDILGDNHLYVQIYIY